MKSLQSYKNVLWLLSIPVCLATVGCDQAKNNSIVTDTNSVQTTNYHTADASTPAYGTNAAATNNVDNTRQNVRDRDNANVTPLDQGNSQADIDLTSKIRQAVVSSTNDFSTSAKNVKIITQNGNVTLRGPVNTDMEKTTIAAIARGVAGEANVTDQLEVKAPSNQ